MDKIQNRKTKPDYWLALAIFGLTMFGLIAIFSVSKYYSMQITDNATDKFFLTRQIIWVSIGLVSWFIVQSIDYRFWHKQSKYMLLITIILLLLPIFFGYKEGGSGARWINLGITSFQPSEIAKITFIFYLAGWLGNKKSVSELNKISIPFFLVVGLIAIIMLIQKDLGTLAVFVGIAGAVFVMSGASLLNLFAGGALAAFLLWLAIKIEPYRLSRLTTFLNPNQDLLGSGYHIRNALIAVGSGGLWGLGFGQSKQKYLYLPEAHTDSIFAIICEELGFFRAGLVVLAFVFLSLRGFKIAREAPDNFGRLLATGIVVWITFQAFVNIGAMLSLIPLTGVPLPFISYGGSNLIFSLAAIGILLNISKHKRFSH
jgi:cell division protein FtsW